MSNQNIIIKSFSLTDVKENDKILFNTNNHYKMDKRSMPEDYGVKCSQTNTSNWIDRFHKDNYKILEIEEKDLVWIKKAFNTYQLTERWPSLFDDDFEDTVKKYEKLVPEGNWFIRTDEVSLKYGCYGAGPYSSFDKILKSMITTIPGHQPFTGEKCVIYFMNWLEMSYDKEFRIFVCDNKITGISQQHLYTVNKWLSSLSEDDIKKMIVKILDFFEKNIKPKLEDIGSYVMDLSLLGNDETPYFIEINPFGKDYSSGSSLFQWVIDDEQLNGKKNTLEFRFVSH